MLTNISWYDAACMNFPGGAELADPPGPPGPPNSRVADLKILNQYNQNWPNPLSCYWDSARQAFIGECDQWVGTGDTINVCVTCYDFGAHGNIFLEVWSIENNNWYNLTKYQESDSTWLNYSTIPIDEDAYGTNKDKLADHWEDLMLADPHCPDTIILILDNNFLCGRRVTPAGPESDTPSDSRRGLKPLREWRLGDTNIGDYFQELL